jgi:thiol-disulfide isomerase/thioredoxin
MDGRANNVARRDFQGGNNMVGLRRTVGACALFLGISLSGSAARGETVLLDFETDWCGFCRTMDPVIQQLAAEGYNVRKVNGDHEPDLVQEFGIAAYPTFVAVSNGNEVGRISGKVSKAQLRALLEKAGATGRAAGNVRGQSPDNSVTSGSSNAWEGAAQIPRTQESAAHDGLLAASVRLRIEDNHGHSTGSGTIIDARDGEALILTCGHVFRDFKESGQILVDTFGLRAQRQIPGQLVCYDLNSDVGLVRIQTNHPLLAAKVAPPGYKCRTGESVVSFGCDHGADATARMTSIVSVDRYNHAPNLQVAFEPVQGRSGGGLFDQNGYVIGVCNAADAQDGQGLFASIGAIHAELDRARLAFVYQKPSEIHNADVQQESLQAVEPLVVAADQLSTEERALLSELQSAGGSEIICLVRSAADPQARSRVLELHRASPAFWRNLAAAKLQADGHRLTSLNSRPDRAHAGAARGAAGTTVPVAGFDRRAGSAERVWPPRQAGR